MQKANSGLATASMIVGIVGICLIPVAPVALGLGLFALRETMGSEPRCRGRGQAITGTVLGSLGTAIVAMFVASLVFLEPEEGPPFAEDLPAYEELVGEGFIGSGFHFRYGEGTYIGCSLHQFDEDAPEEILTLSLERIDITGRVHKQRDVQVLTFEADEVLDEVEPLEYDPDLVVERLDPLVVPNLNGDLRGRLLSGSLNDEGQYLMRLSERGADLSGVSGSPVIHGVSGKVVGVVLTYHGIRNALGYEPLELPESLADGTP